MRFVWQKKQSVTYVATKPGCFIPLIRMVYNSLWWIPIVLIYFEKMDYSTGFIVFASVTVIRLSANLYRNNVLNLEQSERFPFRA
jgi:hypothetical protein